jgi:hypothetical protein
MAQIGKTHLENCSIVDTGASDHMIGSLDMFDEYDKCKEPINVWAADGKVSPAIGRGTICLPNMFFKSVSHVPVKEKLF